MAKLNSIIVSALYDWTESDADYVVIETTVPKDDAMPDVITFSNSGCKTGDVSINFSSYHELANIIKDFDIRIKAIQKDFSNKLKRK